MERIMQKIAVAADPSTTQKLRILLTILILLVRLALEANLPSLLYIVFSNDNTNSITLQADLHNAFLVSECNRGFCISETLPRRLWFANSREAHGYSKRNG